MKATLGLVALATLATASAASAQDPHAGHGAQAGDPHAGHEAHAPAAPQEPPPGPTAFDADRHFPKAEMDAARARLRHEHGHMAWSKVMIDRLELRPGAGPDIYAWDGFASYGGDIDRFVLKSRGEGDRKLQRAELEALWAHAIGPWFNLQMGGRQDLQHDGRTYGVVAVEGLAPYELHLDAALYLSTHGDLSARFEASHDYRVTQRLILQPRAEAHLSAQNVPSQGVGGGLSHLELGLRLRYAFAPDWAPYLGVEHERALGRTARLARAAGEDPRDTRLVIGLRAGF